MIAVELCTMPYQGIDEIPERLLHDMLVYKNVKMVSEHGGTYEP